MKTVEPTRCGTCPACLLGYSGYLCVWGRPSVGQVERRLPRNLFDMLRTVEVEVEHVRTGERVRMRVSSAGEFGFHAGRKDSGWHQFFWRWGQEMSDDNQNYRLLGVVEHEEVIRA